MDFVEQLKSQIDIVKVVGEYVRLKRLGSTGRYLGLCPFHQEKTPSFNVNQTRQFYKCFGCGVGGDALKFVMEVDGLTFPETLRLLAERNGIPMPKRNEYADADSRLRGALQEMHTLAGDLYRDLLRGPHGAEARAYLAKRGVSAELVEHFEIGFSDPAGQALTHILLERKFSAEQLEASGLLRRRQEGAGYYDVFRGRLMFPIHNESGKVIAFGGRAMKPDEQPKYLNSPETPVYKKASTLYNLHHARDGMRKMNRVVLVEGYMDVLGVYAAGVREVVASCGTALTNAQVRAMHRHADTVVVNFDPDEAGAKAVERAIQLLLDEGLHVKVVALEGGLDPDEYVKQNGVEAYQARLAGASTYFHWLADRARGKFDMRTSEGRMDAFKFLMPSVQKVSNPLERAAVANDLADYLGVDRALVLDQFKRAAAEHKPGVPVPKPQPKVIVPELEKILLNALLSSEITREKIFSRFSEALLTGFVTHEIIEVLWRETVENGGISFQELDGRLSEGARTLLHDITAADEIQDEQESLDQAKACLRKLEQNMGRREIDELRRQVKLAERGGDLEEAMRLSRRLMELM